MASIIFGTICDVYFALTVHIAAVLKKHLFQLKRRWIIMMQTPLLLSSFIKRAEQFFPDKLIISRTAEDTIHRIPYRDWAKRTRKLADALTKLGYETRNESWIVWMESSSSLGGLFWCAMHRWPFFI